VFLELSSGKKIGGGGGGGLDRLMRKTEWDLRRPAAVKREQHQNNGVSFLRKTGPGRRGKAPPCAALATEKGKRGEWKKVPEKKRKSRALI